MFLTIFAGCLYEYVLAWFVGDFVAFFDGCCYGDWDAYSQRVEWFFGWDFELF